MAIQMGRARYYHIRPRITVRVGLVVGGLQPGGYCARSNDKLPPSAQWGNRTNASQLEELSSRSPPRKGELAIITETCEARIEGGIQSRHWCFAVNIGH